MGVACEVVRRDVEARQRGGGRGLMQGMGMELLCFLTSGRLTSLMDTIVLTIGPGCLVVYKWRAERLGKDYILLCCRS